MPPAHQLTDARSCPWRPAVDDLRPVDDRLSSVLLGWRPANRAEPRKSGYPGRGTGVQGGPANGLHSLVKVFTKCCGEVMGQVCNDADVIVVGAGPGGSSAAYWLASAGLDVLVLEKTTFPREKVCGDGLTPRGTRALVEMGIDVSEAAGWSRAYP